MYADGSVSDASTFMLYVGEDNSAANVKEGADYVISGKKPFTLKLDESAYSFRLNVIRLFLDGAVINTEGRWPDAYNDTFAGEERRSKYYLQPQSILPISLYQRIRRLLRVNMSGLIRLYTIQERSYGLPIQEFPHLIKMIRHRAILLRMGMVLKHLPFPEHTV